MFEIASYEARRRLKGTAAVAVGLGIYALLMVAFFPSFESAGVDFETYLENLPPAFRNAFGIEALTTIEGFLAVEFYQFAWVILLGIYFAYAAGSLIAGQIEDGRIELVLAGPTSRARFLVETYGALLAPILVYNLVALALVLVGTVLIDESIALADLLAVHALSVPYLLACGAIGLVLSTLLSRGATAERLGAGIVFGLFMVDSVATGTDYEVIGALGPTRYYDPTAVLVHGEYDLAGAAILVAATLVLLAFAIAVFAKRDV